jgi:hypothetical protein
MENNMKKEKGKVKGSQMVATKRRRRIAQRCEYK